MPFINGHLHYYYCRCICEFGLKFITRAAGSLLLNDSHIYSEEKNTLQSCRSLLVGHVLHHINILDGDNGWINLAYWINCLLAALIVGYQKLIPVDFPSGQNDYRRPDADYNKRQTIAVFVPR